MLSFSALIRQSERSNLYVLNCSVSINRLAVTRESALVDIEMKTIIFYIAPSRSHDPERSESDQSGSESRTVLAYSITFQTFKSNHARKPCQRFARQNRAAGSAIKCLISPSSLFDRALPWFASGPAQRQTPLRARTDRRFVLDCNSCNIRRVRHARAPPSDSHRTVTFVRNPLCVNRLRGRVLEQLVWR
ncbi:hypothetical protein EVAR_2356_1 [Eumeta japonica]|uniref:Uncharacterized protein n=1 Tax=Eumeta variegata TaxID=151549 RepID=A0A4C1SGG5_EUMVA|nr:hypothetical protein EVAR_2356_1 [Eumeta japonica]